MEIKAFQEEALVPVTILEVRGNLDSSTADKLHQRAGDALKAGTRNLVLDLTNVHYVSSAGLRVINQLFNQLHPEAMRKDASATQKAIVNGTFKSPHLKLCGLNSNVRQVLSMAGFDMYLDIHPDRKSAVAAFRE
ncbi:MAG: STAS domain-containing protein [Chloroflexi bacterium]|nr:STAS domain-containing protein [Chloroflexota bacterium]